MNKLLILRILGTLLMVFSLSMLPPICVSYWYADGSANAFISGFLLTFGAGLLLWWPTQRSNYELKTRDGFMIVVMFWTVLSLFGALPFVLATHPHMSLTNAMFESVSGWTTTGASVISNLAALPKAILYYRQQLQFLGGMGIIVLAVAVLPMLGIGGMQLYKAETPGPMKESKLTPRLAETAKALWYIYVGLTVLCTLCFWAAGMSLFDAIGESFSTVATGGFTIHDASFAHYHSELINLIAIVFMFLGGVNFSLHFIAFSQRRMMTYWRNQEFQAFCFILLSAAAIIALFLTVSHVYPTLGQSFMHSLFAVVSLGTTTGFVTEPFSHWPTFAPIFLMMVALVGGCAASTSGGLKVIRLLLVHKQGMRELERLIHPRAVLTVKFGKQLLPEPVIQAMWGFIGVFISLLVLLILVLMATGIDFTTAYGAATAALSNAGASIGGVADGFSQINMPAKWVLIFAMLAGRLEVFTLVVIFSPAFWRK